MSKFKPQFHRLLYIDRRLRRGDFPNCSEMGREYEVSARTIQRDIEYMRDMLDAPIEYNPSRRGYFYSEDSYSLPSFNIRESDLFAICIAEKAMMQYRGTPVFEKLKSVFDKLKDFLPDEVTVQASWIDSGYTFLPDSRIEIPEKIWETVTGALRAGKQLSILHRKAGADKSVSRKVDPYHIINFHGQWYLAGYCHKRERVLRFALSRIEKASLTGEKSSVPENFDVEEFIGTGFGIMSSSEEFTVKVRFFRETAPYIAERTWQEDQVIEEESDGSIILSFLSRSPIEVTQWILSWGSGAEVLSPPEIVKRVTSELELAGKNYQQESH